MWCCSRPRERHGWSESPRYCARAMEERINVLFFEPTITRLVRGNTVGRSPVVFALVPLHHFSQCGRGHYGVAFELVARSQSHHLAEEIEIRPGLRGQS